jgi:hypothetical protein
VVLRFIRRGEVIRRVTPGQVLRDLSSLERAASGWLAEISGH